MSHIYFVAKTYSPNAASDIRYRSFLNGFQGSAEITFVYFLPDTNKSKLCVKQQNIRVKNLWEEKCPSNKYLKAFFYYFQLIKFVTKLNQDDVVVDLACCEMLPILFLNKKIKVFYEISEHPEISLYSTKFLAPSVEKFISLCKKLDGLFVISQSLMNYFIESGVNPENIHIINMTVDPSRFEKLQKNKNVIRYIAYCGTASNNKDGVDQLIMSFAEISDKYPDVNLYIIGRTPDPHQEFANGKLVQELGLKDRILFTGAVPYCDVPQILIDAEILALDRPDNKQAKYGFPTKLGEYLITGNPVVITRVGDIPLFLSDEESALIAEPDNVESFSQKLSWALDHPLKAKAIGENGRRVAKKNFNGVIEGRKILDIVKS